ncbi:MAG: hypothetical protein ACYDBB_14675 [Armatimonadota bacterium]
MESNKTTVLAILILVMMVVGLSLMRNHLLSQRHLCELRLTQLATKLDLYANAHGGQLPVTVEEFTRALGPLPASTIDGMPYRRAQTPLRWKSGTPQPYLWDPRPHPFVNGVHALYTDGTVRTIDNITPDGSHIAP